MHITYRERTQSDDSFLSDLMVAVRLAEFGLPEPANDQLYALLLQQFTWQTSAYQSEFPDAVARIMATEDGPIGHMLTDSGPDNIHLIDIAVHPRFQGLGAGTAAMQTLINDAEATNRTITLMVVETNPARRLYERLGFAETGEPGFHRAYTRQPSSIAVPVR